MAIIGGEKLIEYSIRLFVDEILEDDRILDLMFFTDQQLNLGPDLTPPGATEEIREKLPTDFYQQALDKLRANQNNDTRLIFKNSISGIENIKDYLLNKAQLNIVHGYPREAADLPAIAITLGNDDEGQQYLGVRKGVINEDGKDKIEIFGSDWNTQYFINILTPNYDETVIWHRIIKTALIRFRNHMEAYGMREQHIQFSDLEPAPEFLQAGTFMYQRTGTLSCVQPEDIPIKSTDAFTEIDFGGVANVPTENEEGEIQNPSITPVSDQSIKPDPEDSPLGPETDPTRGPGHTGPQ